MKSLDAYELCHNNLEEPDWWVCMAEDLQASGPQFRRCAGCVCELIEAAGTDRCYGPDPDYSMQLLPELRTRKALALNRNNHRVKQRGLCQDCTSIPGIWRMVQGTSN